MGSALEKLQKNDPDAFATLSSYATGFTSFRYIITNASSAIAITDTEIMKWYAELMNDTSIAGGYLNQISEEYYRNRQMLETIYGEKLEDRRPRMHTMMKFRNERLKPLHRLQISQLREWRSLKKQGAIRKTPKTCRIF